MPERIQLRRVKDWRLPEGTVNCARPGPWGNPFVVGRDGTREECVQLYKMLLSGLLVLTCKASLGDQQEAARYARDHLHNLRGKNLACWCRLDGKPCHADVLLELANR
ncbi:MAG: DUF4326 domain-containing protein [Geminicoccaceae bacterium]